MKLAIKNPFSSKSTSTESQIPLFKPKKKLCDRDNILVNILNRDTLNDDKVSLCITDPDLEDNAIVYISPGFLKLTGYGVDDVVGKNCR